MSNIFRAGHDLAKDVFQMHGADGVGCAVLRKKFRRTQVLEFFSQLPPCIVVLLDLRPVFRRGKLCMDFMSGGGFQVPGFVGR